MNIFLKVSSSLNVLLCLIGFFLFVFYIMNIHIYNLLYICTLACIVPENKVIRICLYARMKGNREISVIRLHHEIKLRSYLRLLSYYLNKPLLVSKIQSFCYICINNLNHWVSRYDMHLSVYGTISYLENATLCNLNLHNCINIPYYSF